ncbi:MAG: polysaccharide biosynthesis protein [Prevotella sp.]|nr:polysaccharide biosynthesis protein [Prevotella sp.]MBR6190875.1 polysaccharide biosynthesis protein [Prevotella sp.]
MGRFLNNITQWYFSKKALPYWCVLVLDSAIVLFFYIVSFYCILGGNAIAHNFWPKVTYLSLLVLPIYLIFFRLFHTYSNIIRFSTFIDLRNVLAADVLAGCCVIVLRASAFQYNEELYPGLRIILLATSFVSIAMCSWRVLIKTVYDITSLNANAYSTFIYGAREGAVSLVKSIRSQKNAKFKIKGLISVEKVPSHIYVAGLPVYQDDVKLISRLINEKIKVLMVSPLYTSQFRNNDRLITELTEAGIRIYMTRDEQEWTPGQELSASMLHKVSIEDLLPREKIEVDMKAIGELLSGKSILITGAAGSIGSEMVRQIAQFKPKQMILIDQAETPMHDVRRMMARQFADIQAETIVASITNKTRMEQLFSQYRPDYVFHAAAYKHVPMMEDNPSEAVQNNVYGTRVIADLAVKYGTKKFVMISTDKAVNPTNVMGCSKRICEIYCQALNAEISQTDTMKQIDGTPAVTQFVTTRFGNVLGSNGSVIPIFKEQIEKGGPVTVTHPDIIRFFMLIPEACKLVLEAGTFGKGGEIFVFDMGKPVKIVDLAKRMIALSKAKNIEIKFTGLRDGEKLFEEVLSDAETTVPTSHPKIRVAKVRAYPYAEALRNEERLYEASFTYDDMQVVKIMKEIVPEFKSRHSKYEELDA